MAKRPPGGPRKLAEEAQVFALRLPLSLHAANRAYADEDGFSLNTLVMKAVENWWSGVPEHERYDREAKRSASTPSPKRSKS